MTFTNVYFYSKNTLKKLELKTDSEQIKKGNHLREKDGKGVLTSVLNKILNAVACLHLC